MREPVTRRDALRGLAAGAVAGGAGLAACAGGDGPGAAGSDGAGASGPGGASGGARDARDPAGPPRRGGRIRAASLAASTADTLDPAKGALSTDYLRLYMLYSGLTQYDLQLRAQPGLAEELATQDQREWHVRLRRGVQFHDGRPLTSADVVFSLLRHKDPATASKMKTVAEQIETVTATGPLELRITLSGPNADLPAVLADSHFLIVPADTRDFSRGIGTGPFRLREFLPGVRTVVVRNDNYWRDGRPYLDEIELIGIADEMARVNALLSGDVHVINAVNPRSTRRIRESGTHTTLVTPSSLFTSLIVRQDAPQTGNQDFTLAMKYLFDRPTILRALFRGYASIGNDHPVPPGHPYYAADLPQRVHDPERARWHLKRAGLLGLHLPVYASPAAEGSVEMAAMLQLSAAQAGINIAVNRVPTDSYWSSHWMKHPLSFGNSNPRPTLDLLFSTLYKSDAPWNESGWKNARFDELLLAARAEGEEARRRNMYVEMQHLVHEHCGSCIPAFIHFIDGYDRRLGGFQPLPLGGFMGYQFAEHVWFNG
ncbi:MAG: ABC transporter substrate-binding protein [Steroidobacteraceae bacterium]